MDKLILVFYVGYTLDMESELVENYFAQIKKESLKLTEAEDILFFILPDTSLPIGSIKLDCLNPKHINKSMYDLVKNKVEKIEKDFQNILK